MTVVDAYNPDTESVTHEIARGLCVAAYLATQVGNTGSAWRSVDQTATIEFPDGSPTLGSPAVVQLNANVNGIPLNLSDAQIVWELQGHEPSFGTFASSTAGEFWLEAEALLPDGRRVFAATPDSDPVRIYDPHGGDEDDSIDPNNTIALYHFNNALNDSASHYDLSASGSAAFVAQPG
jgi:hypothetical protein